MGNAHHSALPYPSQVTEAMVTAAQKAWGDGIIAISKSHTDGEDYEKVAREHIKTLYGYDQGDVLFKPTLAADKQFRGTFDGALSYFVAKNDQTPSSVIPEDSGFAIKGWTAVRFENEGIDLYHSTAMAMGNYFFTNRMARRRSSTPLATSLMQTVICASVCTLPISLMSRRRRSGEQDRCSHVRRFGMLCLHDFSSLARVPWPKCASSWMPEHALQAKLHEG